MFKKYCNCLFPFMVDRENTRDDITTPVPYGADDILYNEDISRNIYKKNENIISKQFKSKITTTPVGKISDPIFLPGGILIFKIRDKRKLKKYKNLEDAKYELVQAEKEKILKMHSLSHYDNLKRLISINYY